MSKQIAVRLPGDPSSRSSTTWSSRVLKRSRAAVVTRALERERRRVIATRDAEILARTGPDPQLEGLAEHVLARPAALD